MKTKQFTQLKESVQEGLAHAQGKVTLKTTTFRPPFRQKPAPKVALTFTFHVPHEFGPALKSAIDEISDIVGARLEGPHAFAKEGALTNAAAALGALRSVVNAQVKRGSADYE